ncbi:MAG TPA: DoxX family protein [Elusimicrobiota bacterium]|nr:DoxX family protein [Elusimicrobiota bacterium]
MNRIRHWLLILTDALDWLPGLASRITLGYIFIESGWGKLHHLDKVIQFFTSLGIPAARLQAPFVACVEFGCGTLVLLGLFTRLASVPLIGTMVVAIWTAKLKEVGDASDFLSLSEYLFIVLLVWLIIKGAGALSLDGLLCRRCGAEQCSRE